MLTRSLLGSCSVSMKTMALLTAAFLTSAVHLASAYEIAGAKPIDKLAAEQARAKQNKKLICIVYKGADNTCPHCAAAAENGATAIRASAELVVITEEQVKNKALLATLPPAVKTMLERQPTNAWVSFTVFDQDMTAIIASGDRSSLETDRKAIRQFADKVRDARKELK